MTNFHIPQHNNSVNDIVAEAFNAATIALLGVLGFLTFAAAF
jgi:hypothetical protein